ncbi:DDE Tnp4 domain-containing protein [Mycena indigotica]|uniref:DDE Tnp4 domain-containing protein n=1 Tax=Mycena indigotica TaxID=2126181 RepID=A0A8H6VXJ0_9AGAR|nr:DDE Tnp4 domain-containing protein [Mycena indigotica]KAF7297512.1 DDE Tnp4 domain-containing protein [Mycena indigotica]
MPIPTHRETIRRAILYQFQLRLLCLTARNASANDGNDSESDDSGADSDVPPTGYHVAHPPSFIGHVINAQSACEHTRYLRPRHEVIKFSQFQLLTAFSQSAEDLHNFVNIVRISPFVFASIVTMIENDPVFQNNSQNEQTPVDKQLAVTLYRMGRYGNGGSVDDVARFAGVGHGSVTLFTSRCFDAIERLHPLFVRALSREEKEQEKCWIDRHIGYRSSWREGYLMYDGTIVPLCEKPALNGQAYFTRKSNYGLNVQIGNVPSNLRIIDYSHGFTGSAHDSSAFEYTTARKHPELLFEGDEHGFGDSAYALSEYMIPMFRSPARPTWLSITFSVQHYPLSEFDPSIAWELSKVAGNVSRDYEQVLPKSVIMLRPAVGSLLPLYCIILWWSWKGLGRVTHLSTMEEHDGDDMPMQNDMAEGEAKRQRLVAEINAIRGR